MEEKERRKGKKKMEMKTFLSLCADFSSAKLDQTG